MTLHRRRHPHSSAPQDRLRALGLADSPAARRLHARIPRPTGAAAPPPPIPRAPYALDTADAPYGPPVDTPDEAALDTTVQRTRLVPLGEPDPDAVPTERLRPARAHRDAEPGAVRPGPGRSGGHGPARVWRGHAPTPAAAHETPARRRNGRPPLTSLGARSADPATGPKDRTQHHPDTRYTDPTTGPKNRTQHHPDTRYTDRVTGQENRTQQERGTRFMDPATGPEGRTRHEPDTRSGTDASPEAEREGREDEAPRGHGGRPGPGGGTGRPPSGYTEFDPTESLLERWTRRWTVHAALSRRAVLALTVLGLLAVGATLMALRDRPQTVEPNTAVQAATAPAPEMSAAPGGDVIVHVSGDVADPGLYTLGSGSRVSDAVEAAGGPLPDADLERLNLARPLTDGEQIVVGPPDSEDAAAGTAGGSLVNVNQADAATLETLPGIGEVIAANIIAHREEHGPFVQIEDLADVSKIGDAVLADITPLITVG